MTRQILAVDDEPHMLQLLERIVLERTPYSFAAAANSLDVPRLLADGEYDVIIADVRMPGLDGLSILKLVREGGRMEEVVLITAFGEAESAAEAMDRGAFDYITKPFKKEQLLLTIERAMRCVAIKREAHALGGLFEIEPFDQAVRAFEREYVRRLAQRSPSDPSTLARRAGMEPELVAAILKDSAASETQ